jgi:hypothetical protein
MALLIRLTIFNGLPKISDSAFRSALILGAVKKDAESGLDKALGATAFASRKPSMMMGLGGRMSSAEFAFFSRASSAHGALHGQYLVQR